LSVLFNPHWLVVTVKRGSEGRVQCCPLPLTA
jgi:hypothetical protein